MLKLLNFTAAQSSTSLRKHYFNVTAALGETVPYNFMFLTLLLCLIAHEYVVCEQESRKWLWHKGGAGNVNSAIL